VFARPDRVGVDAALLGELEAGRVGLEVLGDDDAPEVDVRAGAVERPAEVVHRPVVAGDAHRVADDPVLARGLAGADRGDADRRAGGEAGADRTAALAAREAG